MECDIGGIHYRVRKLPDGARDLAALSLRAFHEAETAFVLRELIPEIKRAGAHELVHPVLTCAFADIAVRELRGHAATHPAELATAEAALAMYGPTRAEAWRRFVGEGPLAAPYRALVEAGIATAQRTVARHLERCDGQPGQPSEPDMAALPHDVVSQLCAAITALYPK